MSRVVDGEPDPKLIWSKDLSEFLKFVSDYEPTVPEACVQYYMEKSGAITTDPRVVKIVALATDKFLRDIICDARQVCKLRGQKRSVPRTASSRGTETDETSAFCTLHMEDLQQSLKRRRVNVARKIGTLEQDTKSSSL